MIDPRLTAVLAAAGDLDDWKTRGACRNADPDLFFHPDNERGAWRTAREAAAKAICAKCSVIEICAARALANREPYGVWGGMTESERHEILARSLRGRSAAGASRPG
jgi:WhiB family transcriptional regulator, redox-sensing transcriptional regulator